MILYHGSFIEINKPDLKHSRPNVDFGKGFYTTPIYEQAVKWCSKFKKRGKNGIVTRYEFDENDYKALKILKFDSYSEEWLDFILNCRSGKTIQIMIWLLAVLQMIRYSTRLSCSLTD